MVSESTLRILEDVGELKLYQQEDKDPGVARVRFGATTLDELENPVGFQSQIKRQNSFDSEKSFAIARQDSKITMNLTTTEEVEEVDLDGEVSSEQKGKEESMGSLTRQSSATSSTTYLINTQNHNPSPLKTLAKKSVDDSQLTTLDMDQRYQLQSVNSSCVSL